MKTLKKTLCLVLAVVMAVGVLVIPASAVDYDDFTDKEEIEHTEAVSVLNGMGIIGGKENGNFDPTGTLVRGEAAKLIAYALLGPERAEMLTASDTKFTDLEGSWAAKYISYVATLGIMKGNGDGTVEPEGKLTGYALAKMLLVAAGIEGTYIGADWENNVMIAATQNGILDDVNGTLGGEISRDDAAQMVWNTVYDYAPNGVTKEYIIYVDTGTMGYDADDEVLDTTDDPTTALVLQLAANENNNTDVKIHTNTIRKGSIANRVYGLIDGEDIDAWGRKVKTYTNGKDGDDKVVFAAFDAATPAQEYTTAVTVDKILSDRGYKLSEKNIDVTAYVDGELEIGNKDTGKPVTVQRLAKNDNNYETYKPTLEKTLGGRGSLTQVYKSGDSITIYVINTYVRKLSNDNIQKYKAATADEPEQKAAVVIDGAAIETDKFAKDDVVIYTVNKENNKIVNIAIADTVSGKVTASSSSGYIRIDGGSETYVSAKAVTNMSKAYSDTAGDNYNKAVAGVAEGFKYDDSATYTFYKDFRGNVIATKKGEEEKVPTDYIYVARWDSNAGKPAEENDNLVSDADSGKAAVSKARVIHLDTGAVEIVNVAIGQDDKGDYYYLNTKGALSNTKVEAKTNDSGFKEYVVLSDGSYVFVGVAEQDGKVASGKVDGFGLVKDDATVANGYYANNSTVTTVIKFDPAAPTKSSRTTMTGYNSFPSKTNNTKWGSDSTAQLIVANSNGVASDIYVVSTTGVTVEAIPVNYAVYAGAGETTDVAHQMFYVNGDLVEYEYDPETGLELTAGSVYDIKVDGDELTDADPIDEGNVTADVTVVTIEEDYFIGKVKDGESTKNVLFTFADTYVVVDKNDDYALTELDADDVVTVYVNDGVVEFIVVTE